MLNNPRSRKAKPVTNQNSRSGPDRKSAKTRSGRAGQLTERDQELLRRLGQGQVASLEQLYRQFWNTGYKKDNKSGRIELAPVRQRLAQLVGSGYVETTFTNARRPNEQVYALTPKGAALFTFLERERFTVGLPGLNEMRQQLDMQDTRYILEQRLAQRGEWILDWKGEREIRSHAYQQRSKQEKELGRRFNQAELEALPELADAEVLIESVGSGQTHKVLIECDGAYFNQLLKRKISGMKKLSQERNVPILWVIATTVGASASGKKSGWLRPRAILG